MVNGLAAATALSFVMIYATGRVDQAALLAGFIPARLGDAALLQGLSAVPAWLTPLSCTLVHAGWLHIGFNLLILLFCGRQVEHVLNKGATLLLYAAGAYAACLTQWAFDPGSTDPMVGASGAVSALMGTYALLYSRQNVRRVGFLSANVVRILWLAAAWTGLQLLVGIATAGGTSELGRIAIGAHIGGFMAGLLLTRPLLRWRFRNGPRSVS
ncbi:MAG: rhomboid family intramembrane serine protease [Sphingobium sp.]